MGNHKSQWLIEGKELDIGRGIEAALLGILMMAVRILRTFWAVMAGWKAFEEVVFFRDESETSVTKFARPLTYFSVCWIVYVVFFSDRFKWAETLRDLGEHSPRLLPRILWTPVAKYVESLAILSNFTVDNVVSGQVSKLMIGLIPIMGVALLLTVGSMLSFRLCRVGVVPREHLAIACYALGTMVVIDFVYGVSETYVRGIPHMLLTLYFLVVVWPWFFYRWIALIRCSARTSRKRVCVILVVNGCVLIAFSILVPIVVYAVV